VIEMAQAKKYWEVEKPQVMKTGKNEFRLFADNGKLQVYPRIQTTATGVGRGTTVDLSTMSVEELQRLYTFLEHAIDSQIAKQEGETA
jgi:hypothetical protein